MLRRGRALAILVALAAAVALPATQAGFDERFSVRSDSLVVRNLIGEITLQGHSGSGFEIEVRARGRDATRDNLEIELRDGRTAELEVRFPVDREWRYVYPEWHGRTNIGYRGGGHGVTSILSRIFGGSRKGIRVSDSGRGMELWADVTIRVPEGASTAVELGVGRIVASDVDRETSLRARAGKVEARAIRGSLVVDTGSGSILVENVRGDVDVDTGSGSVTLEAIAGDRVRVDTGSGSIRFDGLSARTVELDTGSGSISGGRLEADDATVDTGSGSVKLQIDRLGTGGFVVDTGSGSIRLELPRDASARIVADTGSGGIHVDFPGADVRRRGRNDAEILLGGVAAEVRLSTGSGSVRIIEAP